MRLILGLILVLSACSSPLVRCDKHLQPINAPAEKQPGLGEQLTDALQRTEREFRTLPREQRGAQRLFRQMRVAGLRKVCGSRFSSPDRCGQRGQ